MVKTMRRLILASLLLAMPAAADDMQAIKRGEYLATLLGCMVCHTEGMLSGGQTGPLYAGSRIGLTYQDTELPGMSFPANLTPDMDTGLGRWSVAEIVRAIKRGTHQRGGGLSRMMPSMRFARLTDEDAEAIAHFLKALEPVNRRIPGAVPAGTETKHPYVKIVSTQHPGE